MQVPANRIRAEAQRGAPISCAVCRRRGATIGCINKKCKRSFHFTCARRSAGADPPRVYFSQSTRNIACWEHPQNVLDPEEPFTGLWMELCGGWNYVRADDLPDLTDAERDGVRVLLPCLGQAEGT